MPPTGPVIATTSEAAPRCASAPLRAHRSPPLLVRFAGALALGLTASGAVAQPGLPAGAGDEADRAWHTAFMARFNARVLPSFYVDPELQARLVSAWDGMVSRLGGRSSAPSPLDQYPLLGFADDRFVVMRLTTARGKESFVVRSPELQGAPTLSSTLGRYLDEVVYPSLEAIALEEREKILRHPGYEPDLAQLAAHNPYQHGHFLRVPEMGPFRNRMVAFTGPGGRLAASEIAEYEERKWGASPREVTAVKRPQRWGIAVELADLVQRGELVARYRLVREVAAVEDRFIGEGRRGVLLRRPRLGPILRVSGCVAECDDPARWTTIYPEEQPAARPPGRRAPSPFDAALPHAAQAGPPPRPY